MKLVKVEMILNIDDECRGKWIPTAICENLEIDNGEELLDFRFIEVKAVGDDYVEVGEEL